MKKFLLSLTLVVFAVAGALAQGSDTMPAKQDGKMMAAKMEGKPTTVFMCTKCDMASMHKGKCKMCHTKMTKGTAMIEYKCDKCGMTAMKGGKCKMDGGKMHKVAMTYVCEHCHTSSAMAGKCEKCGMEMEAKTLKMK